MISYILNSKKNQQSIRLKVWSLNQTWNDQPQWFWQKTATNSEQSVLYFILLYCIFISLQCIARALQRISIALYCIVLYCWKTLCRKFGHKKIVSIEWILRIGFTGFKYGSTLQIWQRNRRKYHFPSRYLEQRSVQVLHQITNKLMNFFLKYGLISLNIAQTTQNTFLVIVESIFW